jgi:hypothetical protein
MRAIVAVTAILLTTLLAATWTPARADDEPGLVVSPETVDIGLDFAGADVTISGTTPEGADVILVVNGPIDSVKMRKKGKVMGLFWMTVEQAEVDDMPAFHVVLSSQPIEHLLSREEQVTLGVDPESSNILDQAQAVNPNDESTLSREKETEFVTALRDTYITEGQYTPWRCYHEAEAADCDAMGPTGAIIRPDNQGHWETSLELPSNAPLGDYSLQAYYLRDSQVVMSDVASFSVEKTGVVDALSSMAKRNAVVYGAMCLGIMIAVALGIGMVFPRPRVGH